MKYENTEGQKIVKKGAMTKKVIRIFERKKCNLGKIPKKVVKKCTICGKNVGLREAGKAGDL